MGEGSFRPARTAKVSKLYPGSRQSLDARKGLGTSRLAASNAAGILVSRARVTNRRGIPMRFVPDELRVLSRGLRPGFSRVGFGLVSAVLVLAASPLQVTTTARTALIRAEDARGEGPEGIQPILDGLRNPTLRPVAIRAITASFSPRSCLVAVWISTTVSA